ncbi:hypothetical protein ZIOFF_016872 [Zingiber officinale]|uniref:Uncharacterized protein n=1 Tax=Zingiber officinale TaxID=94328 RepID=A0A8J5HTB4_ZINOF|nr:hypothetical protein ZIOFF_016872 [Zingiber officinale]
MRTKPTRVARVDPHFPRPRIPDRGGISLSPPIREQLTIGQLLTNWTDKRIRCLKFDSGYSPALPQGEHVLTQHPNPFPPRNLRASFLKLLRRVRDLMEIPVVAEALRIPGLAARLLSDLAGAWTSVALLVAGLAAFYGFLLARAKLALLRFRRSASAISLHSNFSFSGDDDEDDVESSESPSDEDEEEDDPPSSLFDDSASGNSGVDWRWDGGFLDLPLGGAVVRTWEGLGLRLDRAGSGLISLVDLNRGEVLRSFLAHVPAAAASLASPAVVLSAAQSAAAAAAVRVWDARASGEQTPAASAEWRTTRRRRVVGVSGGEGRIYMSDDDGVVTAADLRRGPPLVVETWREKNSPLLPSPK